MATPGQIPAKFVPWGLHPMPKWIVTELENRAKEYDVNVNPSDNASYSGPRTAWVRVFSNGMSSLAKNNQEGFVLGGTEGFNESYGFTDGDEVTIGVDAAGVPHKINSGFFFSGDGNQHIDLPNRPPPSIQSLECEFMGGQNASFPSLCRKIKINWTCNSLGQLNYLEPYFLTPRISVLAEWGWNNYDPTSLVDLTDKEWLYGIFKDQWYTKYWIENSNGNYDLGMGYITDYGISMNDVGGYDCFTTITNANFLIEGSSYQNTTITGVDTSEVSGSIKLKDFTEFVIDDMGNLEIKRKTAQFPSVRLLTSGTDQIFRPKKKGKIDIGKVNTSDLNWIRMDALAEVINRFFSLKSLRPDGGDTGVNICQFKIDNVVINAHPAIKSITKNVLLPNQFAPRFSTPTADTSYRANSFYGTQDNLKYLTLFPGVKTFIRDNEFAAEFDNLREAINPSGESFPVYQDYVPSDDQGDILPGRISSGYWGYFKDIFVEIGFFKSLVSQHDTILKLLEALLQHISEATCNIAQLKLIPAPTNDYYTVVDMNFSAVRDVAAASQLPNIHVGSATSAFIKTAELNVKLSAEMSNQMIMQSATGKDIPLGYGQGNVDPKTMKVSRFSTGDRLFDVAVYDKVVPSNVDKKSNVLKLSRTYTPGSSFFDYLADAGGATYSYILCEDNAALMRSVVNNKSDKNSTHVHNPIMPGTTFNMELLGIGGISYLSQFTLSNVPTTYSKEYSVWQVSNVTHKVEGKMWTTNVTAQVRPLSVL